MEKLKEIKCALVKEVEEQVKDLKHTNAKELGEVIDAIKDMEEAMYYCAIIKAMEKSEEENRAYYTEKGHSAYPTGMMGGKRMYGDWDDRQYYTPYMEYAPYMMRDKDWRESKLYNSRRMYMEGKMNHSKDIDSMKDLEHYIQDLGEDITDMIRDSSNEEKQLLSTKLLQLASKVNVK